MSKATVFRIGEHDKVVVAALIAGDGIDLVTQRSGHRSTTIQLSVEEARQLADAIGTAASESEAL
jgi:hypothetical protein